MTLKSPSVTVLMSVYNAEDVLRDSVQSILEQTFADFEFLIVDDGSVDKTPSLLQELAKTDKRIRIISQYNTGLTIALNNGIKQARGKYIARQDADDISLPDRLERQYKVLGNNPHIALLGGNSLDFFPDGKSKEWGYHDLASLSKVVFKQTPFPHSTVMMRTSICREHGGYDPDFVTSQDAEFWMRIAKRYPIAMLEEVVIKRYVSSDSISVKRRWRQFYDAMRARWRHNRGLSKLYVLLHSAASLLLNIWKTL